MMIPKEIKTVLEGLRKAGFEAFLVGGCVRDFFMEREPEDWDAATNAKPEEISRIFPKSFADNNFGTVTVITGAKNPKFKEVQITPYRIDEKYTDKRHPDSIKWADKIGEDLARRDFTINAMAMSPKPQNRNQKSEKNSKFLPHFAGPNSKFILIDPFGGQEDLKKKLVRAVGSAQERFSEDALRMMRAVRFATTLGFSIEEKTAAAIVKNAPWLQAISKERIRDEFLKIIMAQGASDGIEFLRKLNLLKYVAPELEEGYHVGQNKHHIYDCYEHLLFSLKYAAKKDFNQDVRLAALFHDIAKPRVKRGEGADSTFYGHEIVGARLTVRMMERLKFPKKNIEKVTRLVRYHLFYYNAGEVSEASVRRLVKNVGPENMEELLQVRMADRIGSGVPKAEPYKLRHLKYVVEKVSQDPISAKMLKVNGSDIMQLLEIKPGPKVGLVLDVILSMVLQDPKRNGKEILKKEVLALGRLPDSELAKKAEEAHKAIKKIETKKDEMTKGKYWVT